MSLRPQRSAGRPGKGAIMELRIRNVSKSYPGGVHALHDITLTIPVGVYALLGPKGAGKSTLIRILATQQEPDAGSIGFAELDLVTRKNDVRRLLAYLPQDLRGDAAMKTEQLLDTFAANTPRLVLVDEPAAGLAPGERAGFLHLLNTLGKRSIVIIATSDVSDLAGLCTQLAILHEGRVVLEAEPQRAIAEVRNRVWHRVIAKEELPKVEREYAVISTRLIAGGAGVRVYSNTAPAVGFELADPDLEDVYLSALAGYLPASADSPQLIAGC
jgi:ABC-type multidrug transport system ATPase subunit